MTQSGDAPDRAEPSAKPADEIGVGNKKEALRKRMAGMSDAERRYLHRKHSVERVWPFFRFLILFGLCFVILYPLLFMLSNAFRAPADMNDPTVMWIPRHLSLTPMRDVLRIMDFWKTLGNTLLLNIGCSLVQVVTCAVTGYGFARFQFKGKKLLFGIVILMILVPPQVISVPLYEQFRYFDVLGILNLVRGDTISLLDTFWTMYLPAMTANGIRAGLMILIFRQFFRGLPKELEDAAYLDGCGPLRTFLQVMAPNAASAFLTVFLFSVVWYWNDYYVSSVFFHNKATIALMVKDLSGQLSLYLFNDATMEVSMREQIVWLEAGCLIAILPLLVMYVCLQKYFTEGIERSGLVG